MKKQPQPKVYPKTIPIDLKDISVNYACPNSGIFFVLQPDRMEFSAIYDECDLCGSHGVTRLEWTCACGDWHEVTLAER
jgi:hypothetical protein